MTVARLATRASARPLPGRPIVTAARATPPSSSPPPPSRGPSMGARLTRVIGHLLPTTLLSSRAMAAAACARAPDAPPPGLKAATFAGGCFWGLELAYQRVPGVTATSVGYTGGPDPAPTYETVCAGVTGHAEAVQVYYDPAVASYADLLAVFFDKVDPTTPNRQGNDVGTQYRSAIYYHDDEQKAEAEKAIADVNAKLASNVFRRVLGTKVVSELAPIGPYFLAEPYHQQYLSRGGRFGSPQSAAKGCKDPIRCYG